MIFLDKDNNIVHFCSERSFNNSNNDGEYFSLNLRQNSEKILKDAFKNEKNLNSVIVENNLTTIESSAFENCSKLYSFLSRTNGLDITIQTNAFKDCSELAVVDLSSCSSCIIEKNAFLNCSNLRTIVLPDNADISEDAFKGCKFDLLRFLIKDASSAERYAREHGIKYINYTPIESDTNTKKNK